ncbi:hypothetical protein HUT17_04895 (plasmid) [Nocardiopsis flavescens]|nr:hypothetical protein HUT17_04895 [Nocardiopsis flavescens]
MGTAQRGRASSLCRDVFSDDLLGFVGDVALSHHSQVQGSLFLSVVQGW